MLKSPYAALRQDPFVHRQQTTHRRFAPCEELESIPPETCDAVRNAV
jgi:hypothetical protein